MIEKFTIFGVNHHKNSKDDVIVKIKNTPDIITFEAATYVGPWLYKTMDEVQAETKYISRVNYDSGAIEIFVGNDIFVNTNCKTQSALMKYAVDRNIPFFCIDQFRNYHVPDFDGWKRVAGFIDNKLITHELDFPQSLIDRNKELDFLYKCGDDPKVEVSNPAMAIAIDYLAKTYDAKNVVHISGLNHLTGAYNSIPLQLLVKANDTKWYDYNILEFEKIKKKSK